MEKRVAGFIAAPLWNAFFSEVFKELPAEEFIEPEAGEVSKPVLKGQWRGSLAYEVDRVSGKLATELTPAEFKDEHVLTQIHSILHWVDKNDPRGPIPQNPGLDPQYHLWEFPVRSWAARQGLHDQTEDDIPKEADDIHRDEYRPKASFAVPPPDRIRANGILSFLISAEGKFAIKQIDVFLHDKFLGTIRGSPYRFSADL